MKSGDKIKHKGKLYIAIYAEKEHLCDGCIFINDFEACHKFDCKSDDNKALVFVEVK